MSFPAELMDVYPVSTRVNSPGTTAPSSWNESPTRPRSLIATRRRRRIAVAERLLSLAVAPINEVPLTERSYASDLIIASECT